MTGHETGPVASTSSDDARREYPERPVFGVGAVVVTPDRRVVLIRRGKAPLAGAWSLPGGVLELGEAVEQGLAREVLEETGLAVDVGNLIDIFEHIARDDAGKVKYHYVVADYLCQVRGGHLLPGDDASECALVDPGELDGYKLTDAACAVIRQACRIAFDNPDVGA